MYINVIFKFKGVATIIAFLKFVSFLIKLLQFSLADPNFKQRCPPVFGFLQVFKNIFLFSASISSSIHLLLLFFMWSLQSETGFLLPLSLPDEISVEGAARKITCTSWRFFTSFNLEELLQVISSLF